MIWNHDNPDINHKQQNIFDWVCWIPVGIVFQAGALKRKKTSVLTKWNITLFNWFKVKFDPYDIPFRPWHKPGTTIPHTIIENKQTDKQKKKQTNKSTQNKQNKIQQQNNETK